MRTLEEIKAQMDQVNELSNFFFTTKHGYFDKITEEDLHNYTQVKEIIKATDESIFSFVNTKKGKQKLFRLLKSSIPKKTIKIDEDNPQYVDIRSLCDEAMTVLKIEACLTAIAEYPKDNNYTARMKATETMKHANYNDEDNDQIWHNTEESLSTKRTISNSDGKGK